MRQLAPGTVSQTADFQTPTGQLRARRADRSAVLWNRSARTNLHGAKNSLADWLFEWNRETAPELGNAYQTETTFCCSALLMRYRI